MNYQNFTMLGRMTRDPELRFLPSQVPVTSFGMACSRKFRTSAGEEREETLFIDCQAFAKPAEILSQYGAKGKPLLISGRLRLETWEDRNGGGKRSKISCVVENFQFCGDKRDTAPPADDATEGGEPERPAPKERPAVAGSIGRGPQPRHDSTDPFGGDRPFDPDDVPFLNDLPERGMP